MFEFTVCLSALGRHELNSYLPTESNSPDLPTAVIASGTCYKSPTADPRCHFCSEDNYKPREAAHGPLQFSAQDIKLNILFQFTITHQAEDHHRSRAGTRVAISTMEKDGPWAWLVKGHLQVIQELSSQTLAAFIPRRADLGLTLCTVFEYYTKSALQ